MNKLLSSITSPWKNWWRNLWLRQKLMRILFKQFDISTATEISESDLEKIFAYNFTPGTLPFFIISSQEANIPKRKFDWVNIDECYQSDWYAYIHPNSWSDIIVPTTKEWIGFDLIKKIGYIEPSDSRLWTECNWDIWWLWWWRFQLDKNYGKQLIHTQVSIQAMQTILEQALS